VRARGDGREFAFCKFARCAAQGIAAESPQDLHWQIRGLAAESPVFLPGCGQKNAQRDGCFPVGLFF
jgi:hypothetical protein